MKYLYLIKDTKNEDLDKTLDRAGSDGWDLIQIFPVNEVAAIKIGLAPVMKTYLRCVFKKQDWDA